jgi:predicted ester cyclase
MTPDECSALARDFFEQLDNHHPEFADRYCSPDFRCFFVNYAQPLDLDAYKHELRSMFAAFPDLRHTLADVMCAGDRVCVRVIAHGTHQGSWRGEPPTGNPVEMESIVIHRMADGRLAEQWIARDMAAIERQMRIEA